MSYPSLLALAGLVLRASSELITITQHPSACSASYSTTYSTTTSTSTRRPLPGFDDVEVSGPRVPYNLDVQFGGVDATQALNNRNAKHPGLFRITGLNEDEYNYTTVTWSFGTTSYDEPFKIPYFLNFDWFQDFKSKSITGETKADYQSKLSVALGGNAAFDGFGVEMKETFDESDYVETYQKYASMYVRYERYTVSIIEDNLADLQTFLTPQALKVFSEQDPATIVNTFGTHYMRSATFGGVKRFASKLDVRDEGIQEQLHETLGFTVAETQSEGNETSGKKAPDSAGADFSLDTQTKRDIHNLMETSEIEVIGGTYVKGEDETWAFSLFRDPAITSLDLAPLSDLIANQTKAIAVKQEIDRRMSAAGVSSNALALVTFEDLIPQANDAGSGSHQRIASARTKHREGWGGLGHYALTGDGAYNWDPTKSQGLLISNVDKTRPIMATPTALNRVWGMRSRHGRSEHMGAYEMAGSDPDYVALSGFFLRSDSASTQDIPDIVMVHKNLTEPAGWGGALDWNDRHTGAHGRGQVTNVDYGTYDSATRIMHRGEDASGNAYPEAFFFHTRDDYGPPGYQALKLDFSQVKCLSNCWLGMDDCPPSPC
ncbi:hypothetical protein PRZ48_006445 [Zasmidium cellare]|uniref:MACPF domain-containing protein n=1 Tax=Zasmidium cellare TaxID=395010 RepID=A0ABR0EQD1_ZASCE|nr:hypothetical protein PRZ48_006445 [Zasmidium cellare]